MLRNFLCILVLSVGAIFSQVTVPFNPIISAPLIPGINTGGYQYAYCPSIIYESGVYYMWFGSTGGNHMDPVHPIGDEWDYVRYATSLNGYTWKPSTVVIKPNLIHAKNSVNEHAACDPTVIKFSNYYYLFYGGCVDSLQGVIFVARSSSLSGPFLKLTKRNTWEASPSDPKIIIRPVYKGILYPSAPGSEYGAGEPSAVVVKGTIHIWYYDNSSLNSANPVGHIFHITTTNPSSLNANIGTQTDFHSGYYSVDVKYDSLHSTYNMYYLDNDHGVPNNLKRIQSSNGNHWINDATICNVSNYAHNVGVSGSNQGFLLNPSGSTIFAAFGAPENTTNDTWGYWDMFGLAIAPLSTYSYNIPWGWKIPSPFTIQSQDTVISGDFDGDGITDRCIVRRSTGQWFVYGSKTPNTQGTTDIPWGWSWVGMDTSFYIVTGDFDGDGVTNRCIVRKSTGAWYVLGKNGSTGTTNIPWGWVSSNLVWDNTCSVISGDFDGDGITDRCIVKKSTGQWFVYGSKTPNVQGITSIPWGWQWVGLDTSFYVVNGDFDGDGITDRVIVRKSTGQWYPISSKTGSLGIGNISWGAIPSNLAWDNSCVVISGDFDFDGITDQCIVKMSTGQWYLVGSKTPNIQGTTTIPWGWPWIGLDSSLYVVTGDFDGDGITDRGIIRKSTGEWYLISSKTGSLGIGPWNYANIF